MQEQQLLEWITGGPSGGTDPAALHAALSSLMGVQLTGGSHTLHTGRGIDRPHWALLDKDGAASEDELNELLRGECLSMCSNHDAVLQRSTTSGAWPVSVC